MRTAVWIALGWLGVTFWTALSSRLGVGHVMPDAAIVTVVFVALRREPWAVAITALALGYLVGRQAVAPVGLHETALVACAVVVYVTSGHIAGGGPAFFAAASAVAVAGYHVLLFALTVAGRGDAGFSSWATAVLVPDALLTALLALFSHPWMAWLDLKLAPEKHEGLAWH